jgi:hypothetical protein
MNEFGTAAAFASRADIAIAAFLRRVPRRADRRRSVAGSRLWSTGISRKPTSNLCRGALNYGAPSGESLPSDFRPASERVYQRTLAFWRPSDCWCLRFARSRTLPSRLGSKIRDTSPANSNIMSDGPRVNGGRRVGRQGGYRGDRQCHQRQKRGHDMPAAPQI